MSDCKLSNTILHFTAFTKLKCCFNKNVLKQSMKWDIQQFSQTEINKTDLNLYHAGNIKRNKDTSIRVRDKQLVGFCVTRWLTVNGQHKQTMSNIRSLTLCGYLRDVRCPSSSVGPRVAAYPPSLHGSITIISHLVYIFHCLNLKRVFCF